MRESFYWMLALWLNHLQQFTPGFNPEQYCPLIFAFQWQCPIFISYVVTGLIESDH